MPEELELTPADAMARAVADLWTQSLAQESDHIIFVDHDGNPARIRVEDSGFRIAWAVESQGESHWAESARVFDNPRQAALHAFQGPVKGQ